MHVPFRAPPPAPPSPLAVILFDLAEAGIKATPLAVISMATDRGLTDAQVSEIVDTLASAHGLEDAA